MNPVLEKIKKLLRLSKSPNPHEAALALQKAMELASANHIAINDVDPADTTSKRPPVTHHKHSSTSRLSRQKCHALSIANRYFNVATVISINGPFAPHITFIGQAPDIEIATYIYEYLHTEATRQLRAWTGKRKLAASTRASFIEGFFIAINSRLSKAQQQGEALVKTSKERSDYSNRLYPCTKIQKLARPRHNSAALAGGYLRGLNTPLNKSINNSATERPAIA